jgi:diacylglycerol kinase (ATP)
MHKIRQHHISFKHAFDGIIWAFKSQPNFQIHLTLSLFAIIGGLYFRISATEMTLIILTIVFGLGIEMVNTAIESMTDLIKKEYSLEAKIAKDVAAGMMLLTAIGALFVAGFIFIPKLLSNHF